jgi:hypothetical protein
MIQGLTQLRPCLSFAPRKSHTLLSPWRNARFRQVVHDVYRYDSADSPAALALLGPCIAVHLFFTAA